MLNFKHSNALHAPVTPPDAIPLADCGRGYKINDDN
jgi:hypothetical protein